MTDNEEKPNEEKEIKNNKPGYDSRLHFSKFIVELKQMLLQSMQDSKSWLFALSIFESHFEGLVPQQQLDDWLKEYDKVDIEMRLATQNRHSDYNVRAEILKLQRQLFRIIAPLYIPINQEDDSEDFDFDKGV